jgi:hypothetical protein
LQLFLLFFTFAYYLYDSSELLPLGLLLLVPLLLVPLLLGPLLLGPLPMLLLKVCMKQSLIPCCGSELLDISETHVLKSSNFMLALLLLLLLLSPLLLLLLLSPLLLSSLLLVLANTGITTTVDNANMAAVTSATIDIDFFVFIVVVVGK